MLNKDTRVSGDGLSREDYKIGDVVFYRSGDMPGTFEIMSKPKRDWLFRKYYLTRYNKKDYQHGLPNWKTKRLYHNKIEHLITNQPITS